MPPFVERALASSADDALADQRRLVLDTPNWEAFQAALDAPARRLPRLHRLLLEPSAIELGELK
jgi:uncharacterized protein (DUF1778 family)